LKEIGTAPKMEVLIFAEEEIDVAISRKKLFEANP
jgi:hypothetical protein